MIQLFMIGVIVLNKRGQALVEFVMILPVLLLIVFALIDFGRIILCKNHLEGVMNEVIKEDESKISNYLSHDSEYKINYYIEKKEYKKVTLTVKLELITPGLKSILNNPYEVIVERSVIDE